MPTDPGMLTELLRVFLGLCTAGIARTIPDALALLRWLAAIEIALLALRFHVRRDVDIPGIMMLILSVTLVTFLISNWAGLTAWLINSFIATGLRISGETISVTDFTDPSMLVEYGFSVTAVVFTHLNSYTGPRAIMHINEIFWSGLTAWCTVMFYCIVGVWSFLIQLGFYLATALTVILLPFSIFRVGAFVAEKALGFVVAAAVQAGGVALVTGFMLPILVRLNPGLNPEFRQCIQMFLGGLVTLFLAVFAAFIGRSLTNGVPQLSLQDATRFAGSVASHVSQAARIPAALRAATNTAGRRR